MRFAVEFRALRESPTVVVGHPVKPLSDVGWSDDDALPSGLIATHNPSFSDLARARSAKIDGPEGVSQRFKLQTYSGEPLIPCKF